MTIDVVDDVDVVARRAAAVIAEAARAAVQARGRFTVAFSGGRTPLAMLRAWRDCGDVPWPLVHVLQVDERLAPEGHADRNLTQLRAGLATGAEPGPQIHPMPVESADPDEAARRYAQTLAALAGVPPILDLVHLGLGTDGHTASLVPGDSALDVTDADVAVTGVYQGRRRMTLTFPVLNRARRVMWLITGADKAAMLARLRLGDRTIPGGRVRTDRAIAVVDRAAHGG